MSPASPTWPPSAWQSMRSLVLDLHDRRVAVSDAVGMSYLRVKALAAVAADPGRCRCASSVAALQIDAPYTTVIVDDLEDRGLVRREVNPADRRSKLVRITPAGRAVARKADRIQSAPPAGLSELTGAELAGLERTLRRLVAAG